MNTYLPAWDYRRAEWPEGTRLAWVNTTLGDQLRLWLPPSMVGIRIPNDTVAEEIAWLEVRRGPLPHTWTIDSQKTNGRLGVRIYYPGVHDWLTGIPYIERRGILVWPSPSIDDRYTWYDPGGVPLLNAPPIEEILNLPPEWLTELTSPRKRPSHLIEQELFDAEQFIHKFVRETLVYTKNPAHRLTTEDIYETYLKWAGQPPEIPDTLVVPKNHLARYLSQTREWTRWAGRTPNGFRRGFQGVRYPDGNWLQ